MKSAKKNVLKTQDVVSSMAKKGGAIMKRIYRIDSEQSRRAVLAEIMRIPLEPVMQVVIEHETRKLRQNAAQWPILNAIADQVKWPINGKEQAITAEDFKNILTAAWRNEAVRVAAGVDGGMVLLGHRTREFKAKEWGDWMEYLMWFASDRGVKIPVSKRDAEAWGLE